MFAAHTLSRRYIFDRSAVVSANAANFIGFQVRPSVIDLSLGCVVYGVRCVVYGEWCVVCSVWCVVCGVWRVVCGVWYEVCGFDQRFGLASSARPEYGPFLRSCLGQLWGFIGTCAFVTFGLHIVFFALGFLGSFPSIITNIIWPVLKDILIGLLVVESLTIVARIVATFFLVCFKQAHVSDLHSLVLFCADPGWPRYSPAAVFNLRRECCPHPLSYVILPPFSMRTAS